MSLSVKTVSEESDDRSLARASVAIVSTRRDHGGAADTTTVAAPSTVRIRRRLIHISDSHVSLNVPSWRRERVELGLEPEDAIHAVYEASAAASKFEQQVQAAVDSGADVLIHTGDLLNIPCAESIRYVQSVLERSGLPYLFTSGNHDWCFEGLGGDRRSMVSEDSRAEVRREWCERRLMPLFGTGQSPSHWAQEVGGLLFVAIDNSTCQVSAEQHTFFQQQTAKSTHPIVLLVHVPLSTESLKAGLLASDVEPSNGFLCGDAAAPPPGPSTTRPGGLAPDHSPSPETSRFLRSAQSCPLLVAVLSGHVHSSQAQIFNSVTAAYQFVVGAGVDGESRLLEITWDAVKGRETPAATAAARRACL